MEEIINTIGANGDNIGYDENDYVVEI